MTKPSMHDPLARALARDHRVIFYDALAWFWDDPPTCISKGVLWVAQDFLGVRERISCILSGRPDIRVEVVRPLSAQTQIPAVRDGHPVLSLGGLHNPHFDPQLLHKYSLHMARATTSIATQLSLKSPLIIGNSSITDALQGEGFTACTLSGPDALRAFGSAPLAWATPGLGHVFDLAATSTPTLWLPPANDSQQKQLDLLIRNDVVDAYLNYSSQMPESRQPSRLAWIENQIHALSESNWLRESLLNQSRALLASASANELRAPTLTKLFPSGGAHDVATLVLKEGLSC